MEDELLKILLLGSVEINFQNQPLYIKRRLERAVLYYLAGEHRPISRTTLIDLLWPDNDQIDHRRALRTALSRLRKILPNEKLLVSELDQVQLDTNRCWIDLMKFQDSYENLTGLLERDQKNRTLPAQIVKQIEEALGLWRGDQFLQGDDLTPYPEINSWRTLMNLELKHQQQSLMEKLAEHYRSAGRLESALAFFGRLGQMDLLDVNYHLAVLDILTRMNRYQEAVNYCDALEVAYEKEFNAPLPDIILSQYQYSQIQLNASKQEKSREWPTPVTMQIPLVGRQEELNQLQNAFYQGGIVFIQGELGTGKTRLILELYRRLNYAPRLFYAPSHEMESSLPFSPIIHALRRHVSRAVWDSIDCIWADRVSLLLPELKEYREDCYFTQAGGQPSSRQQLFDAAIHVLNTFTKKNKKILFILDDAQWADRQTLEMISYLAAQRFFDKKGLLVIAARIEEPNPDLNTMIDRFYRNHAIQTIHLNGLSPNELSVLVNQLLVPPPSTVFINQLYQGTNGNPFLALEILRNLMDITGELTDFSPTSHLPIPESVQAIIRNRLNLLDDNTRHILDCAAVIGDVISVDLLCVLAGLQKSPLLSLVNPLVKSGFLHLSQQANTLIINIQFAHKIMRDVVLKEIPPLRLQELHRCLAENLSQEKLSKSQAILIANHYLRGGEIQPAFRWFLEAAAHAWSLGAREDANLAYQQAESLYKQSGDGHINTEDAFELYRQWGEFAYESNQIELLETVGLKLQYLGEQEQNPLLLGISQISLANACFLRLEMETGLGLINRAIDYLKHIEQKQVMMQAKLRQATFNWWLLDYDKCIRSSQEVLEMADTVENPSHKILHYQFFARHSISTAYYAKGEAKMAAKSAQEAYDTYFHKLGAFDRIRALNMLANANLLDANFQECNTCVERGLEIARALENTFAEQILLIISSKAEVAQGYMDEALAHAARALEMGEKENQAHTIVSANHVIGDIYRRLQNYNLALQHYRLAQIRGGYGQVSLYNIENDLSLAPALVWMGQVKEARALASRALEVSQQNGMMQYYVQALQIFGLCEMIEKNLPEAEEYILEAEHLALEKGLVLEQAWCKVDRARIALSKHQFETAEKRIVEIMDISNQRNLTWIKLRGLQFCSQLYKATRKSCLLQYQSDFHALINFLTEHTKSEPLRDDFKKAKDYWQVGQAYP